MSKKELYPLFPDKGNNREDIGDEFSEEEYSDPEAVLGSYDKGKRIRGFTRPEITGKFPVETSTGFKRAGFRDSRFENGGMRELNNKKCRSSL